MRRKISIIVLVVMLINSIFVNRTFAQEIDDPVNLKYDQNGIILLSDEVSNEKINEKVSRAKELGLSVEVIKKETELLYVKDALDKVKEVENYNREIIKKLDAVISDQEKKNEEYRKKQEEIFTKVIGNEWTKEEFEKFILGHKKSDNEKDNKELSDKYSSVSVITKQNDRDTEHPFGFEGKADSTMNFKVGDTWKYKNVFQDSLTGTWVDIQFKILAFKDTTTLNDITLENAKFDYLMRDRMQLQTSRSHVKLQVTFFEHDTDKTIKLEPLIIFSDVDANQGISLESKDNVPYSYLKGKYLRTKEDMKEEPSEKAKYEYTLKGKEDIGGGLIFEKDSRDWQPWNREFWAIFKLPKTDTFTYWFYGGYGRTDGVLHEVGGNAIGYDRPKKEYNKEKIEISLKEIKIYHKVSYEYIGNVPDGVVAPIDNNEYLINQELKLKDEPKSIYIDDVEGGKWTFKGWYADKNFTSRVENDHHVLKDEIIYGAWEFTPILKPEPEPVPIPEPKPEPKPVPTPEPKPDNNKPIAKPNTPKEKVLPKTGYGTNILSYVLLLGLSGSILLGFAVRKKKINN